MVRQVAAADSSQVTLVNLNALVCPGGHYTQRIRDVTVRAPDGVHFPFFSITHPDTADPDTEAQVEPFAKWLSIHLWPKLSRSSS